MNEGTSDLIRQLASQLSIVSRRCAFFKEGAAEFREKVLTLLPIIQDINYSRIELPDKRQVELDKLTRLLRDGVNLTYKLLASKRWHVYENVRLWKQMEKIEKEICRLTHLEIPRVYASPNLKSLPPSVCELSSLKYLDISQCVKLTQLPEGISRMTSLEKIDMRECPQVMHLLMSFRSMKSLGNVICDEEVAWG
ncbi:hypothetical protein MLD38_024757 [Melastoma candidum]|uniref:Uncharacterized protein n=1 Tax=Melastoma candidum TaxID=119954 RepID=A0ACB9NWQ9_9MYRT|nr:hypothetical protein MLD38_024757 [Melastoma candidum]